MSSDFPVAANVVDIREKVDFAQAESFVVDTNVWFWMTYPGDFAPEEGPLGYQSFHYPNFITECLKKEKPLKFSTISLTEIYNVTERTSFEFYKAYNEEDKDLYRKDYRYKLPGQRKEFLQEFEAMYEQIIEMGNHLPTFDHIGQNYTDNLVKDVQSSFLEMADTVIVNSADKFGISDIITDDRDFATVEGITVYTANNRVINAAKEKDLLLN